MQHARPAARHLPVLLQEVLHALTPSLTTEGGTRRLLVDYTLGHAGHSSALMQATGCRLAAVDRDEEALQCAAETLDAIAVPEDVSLAQARFSQVAEALRLEPGSADAVLMDIGVSSMQLDVASRGFSFRPDKEGPLDMRMGRREDGMTAADVVNSYTEEDLATLIYRLSEERNSRKISRAIVRRRAVAPFRLTTDLAHVIRGCFPRGTHGKQKRDPATKTFQALRMHVNEELEELQAGLETAEWILRPGGRLAIITFHSLEDRIAKNFLRYCADTKRAASIQPLSRRLAQAGVLPSLGEGVISPHWHNEMPATAEPSLRFIKRKVISPSAEEIQENPRARSAKLRVVERTEAPALGHNFHLDNDASAWQ